MLSLTGLCRPMRRRWICPGGVAIAVVLVHGGRPQGTNRIHAVVVRRNQTAAIYRPSDAVASLQRQLLEQVYGDGVDPRSQLRSMAGTRARSDRGRRAGQGSRPAARHRRSGLSSISATFEPVSDCRLLKSVLALNHGGAATLHQNLPARIYPSTSSPAGHLTTTGGIILIRRTAAGVNCSASGHQRPCHPVTTASCGSSVTTRAPPLLLTAQRPKRFRHWPRPTMRDGPMIHARS